jgi:hypothetical protein
MNAYELSRGLEALGKAHERGLVSIAKGLVLIAHALNNQNSQVVQQLPDPDRIRV